MFEALFFIFGASLGSFVGVIADRLYVAPILKGRSKCLSCGTTLTWKDLFPVLSYLVQKGKCKYCGVHYGALHLVTEIVYGTIFVFLYVFLIKHSQFDYTTAGWFIYYTILFVVSGVMVLYDFKHKLVPSEYLYTFLFLSFFMMCVRYLDEGKNVWELASPFVLSLPFLLAYLVTKGKGVGFGDILLFAGVGMLLGSAPGLAALLIAVWSASLLGIALQLINRKKFTRKYALPFVPFIIFSTIVVLFSDISVWTFVNMLS